MHHRVKVVNGTTAKRQLHAITSNDLGALRGANSSRCKRLALHLMWAALLAACGGGEESEGQGTGTPSVAPQPQTLDADFGPATPQNAGVLPSNGASCAASGSSFQNVGNYKVYAGDCVISVTLNTSAWNSITANSSNFDQNFFARDFSKNFKDSFDFLLIILDTETDRPIANYPYGQYVTLQTRTPSRTRTLMGSLLLPYLSTTGARNPIEQGPTLHELAHEWANKGIIPSPTDTSHWGYASVGGQLGGFASFVKLSENEYQGYGPPTCYSAETTSAAITSQQLKDCDPSPGFGTNANGGNVPKYAALEKLAMGLIPAGQLPPVTVFMDAQQLNSQGIFKANKFQIFNEAEIVTRMGSRYVPYAQSQKNFRLATLVLTPDATLSAAKVDKLNRALTNFTMDGHPTAYVTDLGPATATGPNSTLSGKIAGLNNFYTATDGAARMRAGGLFAERR